MNDQNLHNEPETTQDAQLRHLLQSNLPVASPSEALRERVARAAVPSPSPQPTPRRPIPARRFAWRMTAGACAAVILMGLWLGLSSKPAQSEVELAQVEAAMARVSTYHSRHYRIEGNKYIKESEVWFANGKWRTQSLNSFAIFSKGTSWFYDADKRLVTIDKNSKGLFTQNPVGFTFTDIIRSGKSNPKATITPLGTTILDGRSIKLVQIINPNGGETSTILIFVDAETNLPVKTDIQVNRRDGTDGHWEIAYSYNEPLSPELFQPKFGSAVRLIDTPTNSKPAPPQNPTKPALQSKPLGQGTIEIYGLEVNSHGSVFLSYKDTMAGRGCLVLISDSLGTTYRGVGRASKAPLNDMEASSLKGQWWVPSVTLGNGQLWRPRTFKIQFRPLFKTVRSVQMPPPSKVKRGPFMIPIKATSEGVEFSIPVRTTTHSTVPPLIREWQGKLSEEEVLKRQKSLRNKFILLSKPR